MESLSQSIRFCASSDAVRLAYATTGHGPPLVRAAHWLTHLEFDLDSPVWRPWLTELSRERSLVRYDMRNCGLSDRSAEPLSLDAWVADLEAVVDAAGLERFELLGCSQGAAVSIAYAVRHPDRVSALVLYGAYARGSMRRDPTAVQVREARLLLDMIEVGWGRDNPAFRGVHFAVHPRRDTRAGPLVQRPRAPDLQPGGCRADRRRLRSDRRRRAPVAHPAARVAGAGARLAGRAGDRPGRPHPPTHRQRMTLAVATAADVAQGKLQEMLSGFDFMQSRSNPAREISSGASDSVINRIVHEVLSQLKSV
jgi:pimeloyl-ACP methyl ester carboxylesterase